MKKGTKSLLFRVTTQIDHQNLDREIIILLKNYIKKVLRPNTRTKD